MIILTTEPITGYKVFNSDWTCKEQQYKVGQSYTYKENLNKISTDITPGVEGMHFCKNPVDCLRYYPLSTNQKYAKVSINPLLFNDDPNLFIQQSDDKTFFVTNALTIDREIPYDEWVQLCNGTSQSYYPHTNNVYEQIYYSNGLMDGSYNIFTNQRLLVHHRYKKGYLSGMQEEWDEEGNKIYENFYNDYGFKDGEQKFWYKGDDGNLVCQTQDYIDGYPLIL